MKYSDRFVRMTFALGALTLIGMVLCIPALSDIARGETDLELEWATLRVTALLILMFIALSFATIRRAVRNSPQI